MGIKDLFRYVDGAIRPGWIYEFRGKTVAVDISCWLYKGLYFGDYIEYINKHVRRLTMLRCKIIMVFDGKPPSAKDSELKKRAAARIRYAPSLNTGVPFTGTPRIPLRVTPEITANVKQTFGAMENVTIVQAPGEADPQLAYLALKNLADVVITDDSDIIVYGVETALFKLTPYGRCNIYERSKMPEKHKKSNVFRWICIMAGCDYLPGGFRGLGLNKAAYKVQLYCPKSPHDEKELRNMLESFTEDQEFIESFMEAERTFLYQNVLDPETGIVKPLNVEGKIY